MANTPKKRKNQGGVRPGRIPGTFQVSFTDHNQIRRRVTCRAGKKSDAVKFRNSLLIKRDRIRAGLEKAPEEFAVVPTLEILWKKFERNRKIKIRAGSLSKNTLHRCWNGYNNLIQYDPLLNYTQIDKITSEDIENFKIYRLQKGFKPAGVKIDFTKLKTLFNFAVDENYIIKSPCKGVSTIKIPRKDVRFINEKELTELFKTLKKLDLTDEFQKDAHDLVIFYLYTGARASEAMYPTFNWDCINKDSIHFPRTKASKNRTIPILKSVADMLDTRRHIEEGPFKFNRDKVYKRVRYVFRKAEIKDASTHTLRRTAGAWYYMATKDIFATSKYLLGIVVFRSQNGAIRG